MTILIIGLLLFLGTHSIGLFAHDRRDEMVQRLGETPWKLSYALVALVGFVLIVYGYGQARLDPTWLWHSPIWTRHIAALVMVFSFVLLAAAYVPGNAIKAKLGHPMLLATKLWALVHLLSNGTLADVFLFGGFLVWAIVAFAKLRRRDRAEGVTRESAGALRTVAAVVIGLVLWAAFAFYLHEVLIGVRPFG